MNEITKSSQGQQLEKAQVRQENHEGDAASLKTAQDLEASRLQDSQNQGVDKSLGRTQKAAASALEESQKENAEALKSAHEDHEARLKRFQESERDIVDEKNQVIAWLTGGYSVDDNKEKEEKKGS